jgi:hypothetical protein
MKTNTVLRWVAIVFGLFLIIGGLADKNDGPVIGGAILVGSAVIAFAVRRD